MLKTLEKADRCLAGAVAFFCKFLKPERVLLFLFLFLLLHTLLSTCFNNQLYRDVAGVYAWYAGEFGRGVWWDIPLSQVPVLNVFLGGLLVRCGVEPYTSVILLSLLFMGLTILPLYKLLQIFLPPEKAVWGCVLFTLAPKVLRFAGTGLLESTRDFFIVSAMYLLFKSWNGRMRWYEWGLFGLALGGLTIARGEGIVLAALMGAGLLIRPAAEWRSLKLIARNILFPALVSGVLAAAVMMPVVIQNFKVTGFPVTDARMISVLQAVPGISKCFTMKLQKLENDPRQTLPDAEREAVDGNGTVKDRLQIFPKNVSRGAYEPYFILAAAGIVLLLRRRQWRKEYSFLIGYSLLAACSFINFSVAYRYFIFFIPLMMVFTLCALNALLEAAERKHCKNILITLLAVLCAVQPFNAWAWMMSCDKDELAVKAFVAENRHRFLPEGVQRKLIIHGDPRLIFRSGGERLFHYGEIPPRARYVTGFDLMFVFRKKTKDYEECKKRRDLRQIEAPFKNIFVFAPAERKRK